VLTNDTDLDNQPITAQLVSGPTVGTLTFNANGSLTYTAPADLVGPVTFTYWASDGADHSDPATVTLTRQGLAGVTGDTLTVVGSAAGERVRLRPVGTAIVVETQSPASFTRQVVRPPAGVRRFTRVEVLLGAGDDRLDAGALRIPVRAVGGAGNDVIRTGAAADTVFGDETDGTGTGTDVIETGAGSDTVTAGSGGSFIDAGNGNDFVTAAGGRNWILGGAGNDVLIGGTGGDLLFGEGGKDLLVGGLGADLLEGGPGTDILFDGQIALATPAVDTLSAVLASYVPSRRTSLVGITGRIVVTFDTGAADTLTGGTGTDWFWSNDPLDVLDRRPTEPLNAVV
jgi:Ca2+-binding RTX toxin-like protein